MSTDFDAYRILSLDPSASQEEIEARYRRLTVTHSGGTLMPDIEVAYRLLRSPEERRAYDERRAAGPTPAPQGAEELAAATGLGTLPPPNGRAPWGLMDIFLAVLAVIGLGFVAGLPFAGAAIAIAGSQDEIDHDALAYGLYLLGNVGLQFAFVFTAWFVVVRRHHLDWSALGFRMPERGSWWFPFVLWAMAMAIVISFSLILEALDVDVDTDLDRIAYTSAFPIAIVVLLTLVFAPVAEEVFLRGFVFQGLSARWGAVLGAVVSGALFGAAHVLNPGGLYVVWPIAGIGILFAWGFYYSRSILPGIVAHFLFNGVAVAGSIAQPPKEDDPEMTVHSARLIVHIAESIAGLLR